MTTGVFSEVFSPNRKVASDVRALLGQYETLQGDGDLLTTNQKNNLTVHEMTTNNRKSFFFFCSKPSLPIPCTASNFMGAPLRNNTCYCHIQNH